MIGGRLVASRECLRSPSLGAASGLVSTVAVDEGGGVSHVLGEENGGMRRGEREERRAASVLALGSLWSRLRRGRHGAILAVLP